MTSSLQRFRNFDINLTQAVKLVVYVLLLINFAFYIVEDWQIAQFTRANGGTFLQWTSAFATSIDELAWFILLFLLHELDYDRGSHQLAGFHTDTSFSCATMPLSMGYWLLL